MSDNRTETEMASAGDYGEQLMQRDLHDGTIPGLDASWAGFCGKAPDFIMLHRMAHNLKLMNCLFPEFSIQYFWTVVDWG